ncbi:hypothetical protein HW090_00180 [Pseudomonas sp. ABC1]|nr:hypothetical protein HW090_00180 [Pseudomonas sp. ABC1]
MRISRVQWQALLDALEVTRRERQLLTYRSLLERLQLTAPAMLTLTSALEHLAALDAKAGRPLRSALVISQSASRLPRTGFFECAHRLGCCAAEPDSAAAVSWHAAEVARVFDFDYPEAT